MFNWLREHRPLLAFLFLVFMATAVFYRGEVNRIERQRQLREVIARVEQEGITRDNVVCARGNILRSNIVHYIEVIASDSNAIREGRTTVDQLPAVVQARKDFAPVKCPPTTVEEK